MKDIVKRITKQITCWQKIFTEDISDNKLIQNIKITLKKQQNTNNPI